MKCSACSKKPIFVCKCSGVLFCQSDLLHHLQTPGNHSTENLIFTLEQNDQLKLKYELDKRIQKIERTKTKIYTQTQKIILSLLELSSEAISSLDRLNEIYLSFFTSDSFYFADKPLIDKILRTNLDLKFPRIDLPYEIKKAYTKNLINDDGILLSDRKSLFLKRFSAGFNCGSVSTNEKILLTGSYDGQLRVFDLKTKEFLFSFEGHSREILSTLLINDKDSEPVFAVSGSSDGTVRIWDLNSKHRFGVLYRGVGTIVSLAYCSVSSKIIGASYQDKLIIWDFPTQTVIEEKKAEAVIMCLLVLENEDKFVSGYNNDIRVWDLNLICTVGSMTGHSGIVSCLAVTNGKEYLVSGSYDKTICVWLVSAWTRVSVLAGHSKSVLSVAVTQNQQYILSGSADTSIRIWSFQYQNQVFRFNKHTDHVFGVYSVNNNLVSISKDATVGFGDLSTLTYEKNTNFKYYLRESEIFLSDPKIVAYISRKNVVIENFEFESEEKTVLEHAEAVKIFEVSSDMCAALTCANKENSTLVCWDLFEATKTGVLNVSSEVICVSISADGALAASGSKDHILRLWNLNTFVLDAQLVAHTASVLAVKFSLSSSFLISASADRSVVVWNVASKTQIAAFAGNLNVISKVVMSDDEKFVIAAAVGEGIQVWNLGHIAQKVIFKKKAEAKEWLEARGIQAYQFRKYLL